MKAIKEILEPDTIIIDEPALRQGFTVVPNFLFGLKELSHGARLTYVLLLKYAWNEGSCFPGVERLARELEVERKSVMRYTRELQNQQLVSIERRGQGKTNVYHLKRWQDRRNAQSDTARASSKPRMGKRGRSPTDGTSGNPANGTSRNPTDGTVIRYSRQRLRRQIHSVNASGTSGSKEPDHVAYLVEEIMKVCGDRQSIPFYRQVVRKLDDHSIFRLLAEVRQDRSIRNRGAVFTSKVQALWKAHS